MCMRVCVCVRVHVCVCVGTASAIFCPALYGAVRRSMWHRRAPADGISGILRVRTPVLRENHLVCKKFHIELITGTNADPS